MTTFDERRRALCWGRQLLEELAAAERPFPHQERAARLLANYPSLDDFARRLETRSGYALLFGVRSIDGTAGLLEQLVRGPQDLSGRAVQIARHFPERHELAPAVRTPYDARAWAAMYLDRSPGRSALLRLDPPTQAPSSAPTKRQRRQSLRQLTTALHVLRRDPGLTSFALGQVHVTIKAVPDRRSLARRFQDEGLPVLTQHMRALQQACYIVEAVADGTLVASRRAKGRVQVMVHRLPCGDWFALTGIAEADRQAWIDELFMRRPLGARRGGA